MFQFESPSVVHPRFGFLVIPSCLFRLLCCRQVDLWLGLPSHCSVKNSNSLHVFCATFAETLVLFRVGKKNTTRAYQVQEVRNHCYCTTVVYTELLHN